MEKKLFVGGLSWGAKEDDLKNLFSQAGEVISVVIIRDKFSGRSKGFGFVEMSSEEESRKAIEMFDGQEFDGRKITVNEARPLAPRPRKGKFSRR